MRIHRGIINNAEINLYFLFLVTISWIAQIKWKTKITNRKIGKRVEFIPLMHIYDRSVQARLQKVYHDTILPMNMYGWYALCEG